MRVAVYHDLPSGGAKRVLREQVVGLRALGHVVDAFIPSTADESFLPLAPVLDGLRIFPAPAQPSREAALSGRARPALYLQWLRFLAALPLRERRIARAIDAGGYDVVLAHPSQFTQAPPLLDMLRTPSVYYCHEPLRAAYEPRIAPAVVRFALRTSVGRIDRRAVRAATRVAVNSRHTAENVRRWYGRSSTVVYPGVDTRLFRPLPQPRADFVLAVGALHPLKGIDFLIESLARLPQNLRPRLVVVSDRARDGERQRIERAAAAGGVQVDLRTRVTDPELVALYNRCRLVLYAPHDEPFGFVPLEAMACGRPVLGVAEGGLLETIRDGETGFLAPRDAAFAARLRHLLENPDEAEEVGAAAVTHVRTHWSWAGSVQDLEALCIDTSVSAAAPRGGVAHR